MTSALSLFDFLIVISAFIAVCGFGVVASKSVQSQEDYSIGDRSTPWWVIGLSVFATYTSSLSFLGGPGWSYNDGIATLILQANFPLVAFLVASYFVPVFYNLRLQSIYQFYGLRYGRLTESSAAMIFLITQCVTAAGILYSSSLVISSLFEVSPHLAIALVAVLTLAYSASGGIKAVMWTDVLQSIVLLAVIATSFILVYKAFLASGGDIQMLTKSDETKTSLSAFDWNSKYSVWAAFIAMSVYRVQASGTSQTILQRTLTAKTQAEAKASVRVFGFLATPTLFILLFMGLMLHHIYDGKEFAESNTIILVFLSSLKIPGLMGLVVTAIFAASMSSLDSALNSLATVTVKTFFPENKSLPFIKLWTLFWLLLTLTSSLLFVGSRGSVLENVIKIGSYAAGAELGLCISAFLLPQTSQVSVLTSFTVSMISVFVASNFTTLAWPWFCLLGTTTFVAITLISSRLLKRCEPLTFETKDLFRGCGPQGLDWLLLGFNGLILSFLGFIFL